jgi:hypothetical protein
MDAAVKTPVEQPSTGPTDPAPTNQHDRNNATEREAAQTNQAGSVSLPARLIDPTRLTERRCGPFLVLDRNR